MLNKKKFGDRQEILEMEQEDNGIASNDDMKGKR